MERMVDARGLRCPLPYVKARLALETLAPGDALVVLATDPEAPVDVGALAADCGRPFSCEREGEGWRLVLAPRAGPAAPGSSPRQR